MPEIKTVPNQRVITVNKAVADKQHLYTVINLQALNNACNTLQSKAGGKVILIPCEELGQVYICSIKC